MERGRFRLAKRALDKRLKFIKEPVMLSALDAAVLADFLKLHLCDHMQMDLGYYRELMDLLTKGSKEFRK